MAANPNARLEAFCDGVFAIAITLLIIEIKPPAGEHIETSRDLWLALKHLLPSIFAFVLSFGIILITSTKRVHPSTGHLGGEVPRDSCLCSLDIFDSACALGRTTDKR